MPAITDTQYDFVTDPNLYVTDIDEDGITERMVKFDREAIKQMVDVEEDLELVSGGLQVELELTLTGTVAGMDFEGSSTLIVILKGQ